MSLAFWSLYLKERNSPGLVETTACLRVFTMRIGSLTAFTDALAGSDHLSAGLGNVGVKKYIRIHLTV